MRAARHPGDDGRGRHHQRVARRRGRQRRVQEHLALSQQAARQPTQTLLKYTHIVQLANKFVHYQ